MKRNAKSEKRFKVSVLLFCFFWFHIQHYDTNNNNDFYYFSYNYVYLFICLVFAEGKPIPTELRNEEAALRRQIDLEDENTAGKWCHALCFFMFFFSFSFMQ